MTYLRLSMSENSLQILDLYELNGFEEGRMNRTQGLRSVSNVALLCDSGVVLTPFPCTSFPLFLLSPVPPSFSLCPTYY